MTTQHHKGCPVKKRKLARALRVVKRRKEERAERRRVREEKLSKTLVAQSVSDVINRNRVITYEDLDGDQLVAYHGIHEWWNVQSEIGGVSTPLSVGGYAGTGKSTLLAIALPVLKNSDGSSVRTKYCAYTGKASNVLAQKGLDSQTIHSLIYDSIPNGEEIIFVLKDKDDIEAELVVVDEASMVPDSMRKDLESLGIPILYTGDHGQLPPIAGYGNVMDNPVFKLETPHRQALESGIIEIASMVRNKKRVRKGTYGKHGDANVIGRKAIDDIDLLAAADMVICYTNTRRHELNRLLRRYYGFEGIFPKVGERLICVKNNKLTRMFNGLIVQVKDIKIVEDYLVMDVVDEVGTEYLDIKAFPNYFQGDSHPKIYGRTLFDVFEFAYAITGHKSQGSQWDNVVVIEESMFNQSQDIKRRWMYTTLTRAAIKLTWISKHN